MVKLLILSIASIFAEESKTDLDLKAAVELSLLKSIPARQTQTSVSLSDSDRKKVLGIFDWQVSTQASYEISRLETSSGTGNLEDKTKTIKAALIKKTQTGTSFSFGLTRQYIDSTLSSFSSSLRSPSLTSDGYEITIRQDLLSNIFGYADRKKLNAASLAKDRAEIKRLESLEGIALDTASTFLKTFVSQENLKNSLAAREKYETLVKTLRYKKSVGLVDASDLAKVEAEFLQQDKRIKQASLAFLASEDALKTLLSLPKGNSINLIVPKDLPDTNQLQFDQSQLRRTKELALGLESAQDNYSSSKSGALPELALFGSVSANGIDKQSSKSFSELTSNQHPKYLVGLELKFRLDSELAASDVEQKRALLDASELEQQFGLSKFEDELTQTLRDLETKLLIAKTSIEITKKWESSILDQERKYKSGRARLSELIQDYSSYFQSQADLASAQSDFWIAYLQFQAARDRLVTSTEGAAKL